MRLHEMKREIELPDGRKVTFKHTADVSKPFSWWACIVQWVLALFIGLWAPIGFVHDWWTGKPAGMAVTFFAVAMASVVAIGFARDAIRGRWW